MKAFTKPGGPEALMSSLPVSFPLISMHLSVTSAMSRSANDKHKP